MKRKVIIELEDNDWGQIMDGLTCRAEDYERTAEYHETGHADDYILETRDADEARDLAAWYRRLVEQIRMQLNNSSTMIGEFPGV
jgi:hypothetical protein